MEVVTRWRRGSRVVLWEAGSRKGRKKGTITSDRLLPQRRQPGRSFRQNMVAACSKATFLLLSGVIEVTSEGGKRGPSPTPTPTPPPATLPLSLPHYPTVHTFQQLRLIGMSLCCSLRKVPHLKGSHCQEAVGSTLSDCCIPPFSGNDKRCMFAGPLVVRRQLHPRT